MTQKSALFPLNTQMTLFFLLFLLFLEPMLPVCHPDESNDLISMNVKSRISTLLKMPISQIRLDPMQMRLSSNYLLLPFHEILIQSPLDSADVINRLTQALVRPPIRFETLINNASILINKRIGSIPEYKWLDSPPDVKLFLEYLSALSHSEDLSNQPDWRMEAEQKFRALPIPVQTALSNLIFSLSQATGWMREGRNSISTVIPIENLEEILVKKEISPQEIKKLEQLAERADRKSLFRASALSASCLSAFLPTTDTLRSIPLEHPIIIPTPAGDIILAGTSSDIHELNQPPLLLIDCGGNDTYKGVYAQSNHEFPSSIVIDLGGEDTYHSDSPAFGAVCGVAGFAALLDLGQEADHFQGTSRCFGYSFCGVSLLYDESGDSEYKAESLCFAASETGISILFDGMGNDTFEAFSESQGYGDMGGFGLLLDSHGNDRYIAPATPVVNPSAQLETHNFSASQGFGTGRFGPTLDGCSFPGGIGLLLDEEGNDMYEASVFSQGSGYGYGIGILADRAGNDRYQSAWYAMGSAAHQGCGFLIDGSGDDTYDTSHYMMAGAATDFSLGVFVDGQGNDTYRATNAALGYSLLNSFSFFLDREGEDRYTIANHLGAGIADSEASHILRGLWPTFGLFIDEAGVDHYEIFPDCRDNVQWTAQNSEPNSNLHALGIDLSPADDTR